MSQLFLADIKRHCQAEAYDTDDQVLSDYLAVAEEFVKDYTRRDLDAEFPGAWPLACIHAVKLLVAHWYQNREATGEAAQQIPFGVRDLLAPHRDLS